MTKDVSDHSIYAQGPFANTKMYRLENMRHWIRGLKNTELRSQESGISDKEPKNSYYNNL